MDRFTQQFSKHTKSIGFARGIFCVVLIVMSFSFPVDIVAEDVCPLFPVPKQWADRNTIWTMVPAQTVIAISESATEQQEYAAERLQTHIKNRFKTKIPVIKAKPVADSIKTILQLETTSAKDGKFNGFTIQFKTSRNGQQVADVFGNDDNGTIYGGDVLFDMMFRGTDGSIQIRNIDVCDWPSIPWRGRPHFILMQNLVPGVLDAYVRARMNYTDVRDNPSYKVNIYYPDRAAPMGFPPGLSLDKDNIGKMIKASQRRGLFVYGCVAAATAKHAGGIIEGFDKINEHGFYDNVNKTFEELIELGCNGLWLSFDDIGKGVNSAAAIDNFLKLGKKHNLSGRQLGYTPPAGDYNVIDTPFNHEAAKIPGFNEIQWFFTRVPCKADADMCKQLGLKLAPAWWHNLISLRGGFMNNANIAVTLRDGHIELPKTNVNQNSPYNWSNYPCEIPLPAYLELQPLSAGWGAPKYDKVRDAAQFIDNVMLWCVGGGWPEEYLVTMIGNWAWAPETHDWERMRTAIYSYVYGPGQAETARRFDDAIVKLKSLFELPIRVFGPNKGWPCRLKKANNRQQALTLIDELQSLSQTLSARAPAETGIDPVRLENIYLEPMRATLVYARRMALLDYPEDSLAGFDNRMFKLIEGGNVQAVQQAMDEIRPKVEQQLARISIELEGLKGIKEYVSFWKKRVSDMEYWKKEALQRRKTGSKKTK